MAGEALSGLLSHTLAEFIFQSEEELSAKLQTMFSYVKVQIIMYNLSLECNILRDYTMYFIPNRPKVNIQWKDFIELSSIYSSELLHKHSIK